MTSEWLRVMLDEIARQKAETEAALLEDRRRAAEKAAKAAADAAPCPKQEPAVD